MTSIVVIDDDLYRMQNALEALRMSFPDNEIREFVHFEEAKIYLKQHKCVVILDIMFVPTGVYQTAGFDAGIEFYNEIKSIESAKHKVLIYTNRSKEEMKDFVSNVEKNSDGFLRKLDTGIVDLIQIIKGCLDEWKK